MNALYRWFLGIFLILIAFSALAAGKTTRDKINVLTLNQYLGADLTPVLAAPDAQTFNEALVAVLAQTARSDFSARARAQAMAISNRAPDIVALQEVWQLSCTDFDGNPSTGCEDPMIANAFLDHLELTLDALNNKGKKRPKYEKAAVVNNLDTGKIQVDGFPVPGIPFNVNGVVAVLLAVDRDVILVRDTIEAQPVDFLGCLKPSADGCNYQTVVQAQTPAGPVNVERGFAAIDATVKGKDYRLFNTHLEVKGEDVGDPLFTFYQASQAFELIQTIAQTVPVDRTVLLLGDTNSSPLQENPAAGIVTPYNQFLAAQYFDIWDLKKGNQPGYSCCQAGDLKNRKSALFERIDMIFSLDEPATVKKTQTIKRKARTVVTDGRPRKSRVWFSDHAAVTSQVQF